MGKRHSFLGFLASVFVLIFSATAFADGFECTRRYIACNDGKYLDNGECITCPTGCTCAGGTAQPVCNATITYDLNGGSGTTPSETTCPGNASCVLAAMDATTFWRGGYKLIGWSTDPDATTADYTTAGAFNGDTTLYAVWSACPCGTYHPNAAGTPANECTATDSGYYAPQGSTAQTLVRNGYAVMPDRCGEIQCPPNYRLSGVGDIPPADNPNQCAAYCDVPCDDPGLPNNAVTGTDSDTGLPIGYSWTTDYTPSSGYTTWGDRANPTCTIITQSTCPYTNITCKTNYYLNTTIWHDDGNGTTIASGTEQNNACLPCSGIDGALDWNYCAPNSLDVYGGGPNICHTDNTTLTCSTILPPPTNATSCTYKNYLGTTITTTTGVAYYPSTEITPLLVDADGNGTIKPKGCYVNTCTCAAGYKYVAPAWAGLDISDWDETDPGECVPDTFTVTLNDNGGSGGTGTIYEKYSTAWYSDSGTTTTITDVAIPQLADHLFAGYYDAQTGGNLVIPASGVLPNTTTFNANAVLYAHWSEDSFTCTVGETASGATCPAGSYCPGGSVAASLKNDPTSGCARTCPTDSAGGTPTSDEASTLITQCKTSRTNVDLPETPVTGKANQTCFYDDGETPGYSASCTYVITSCNAGRYRESETSITCAVVGKGAYSPANDIAQHLCSDLAGADATVTTETDTSAAATACYNTCSDIPIDNGSRKAVNAKEYYNGTSIPACSYTTQCNTGYGASGETCTPNVYTITLNHNNTGCTSNCTTPTSPIYLKYNTGWYTGYNGSTGAVSGAITTVTVPNWPGKAFGGYFSASEDQIIDATGKLTETYDYFTDNATITASWETKPVVNCAAGTYYTGTGTTCTDCPAGSYCGGTAPIQDNGVASGIEQCPSGTYTAATDASGNPLTVTVTSATKSKQKSDCFATNVAYTATQGAGSRTCYYNTATGKYASSCKDMQILTCTTGHYLASSGATDCAEVTAGYYSPDILTTRTECPNRNEDNTITTQSTTAGAVTQCYRGNIWYEPAGGHSGHRRNCYHKPADTNTGIIDTNITTGYTYNCDVSVIVTCDTGYYDDGTYKNTNNERDCVPVGYGNWSPAQTACSGEDTKPSMDNPGCSTQINACPAGIGATDVVSLTPSTATETSGAITDCYLTCNATKNLNGTIADVINSPVHYNITKNAYDKCIYDSNVCPADMWCDPDGFHDCPADNDGTVGKATLVEDQKYRGIETCYVVYDPYQATAGYPNHNWEHGTGWAKCFFNGDETTGDYNNCMDVNAHTCEGGYFYKTAGSFACSGTTSGYYSANGATVQTECPLGWAGSTEYAVDYTACYTECGLTTSDIPHSKTVSAAANIVYGNSATTYNACSYNVVCNTGYDVQNNNTASPSCAPHEYTITLNKNGGTGSTPTSVNCTFDSGSCALPAIVDARTGYSTANKWCTAANGSGTCYDAGTTVTTNISADAGDITLYAKWTPNIYTVNLNHNGAATAGAPATVYLKYATGWYSNATATTAITEMATKPVKGVLTFAGYTGNDVTVIDSDGKFVTTTAALTFTSANPTVVTAQWTDAPITCSAGTYYRGTGETPSMDCLPCNENNYCPGVTVVTNSGQAGQNPCPDNGKAPANSIGRAACYKELLPTYVATHGAGTQTCYYDEDALVYSDRCKDFVVTSCDAGHYLANTTDTDCAPVGVGYYSANLILTRDKCPNDGTTASTNTTAETVQECFKTNLDYAAIDGSGTGTQSCWYSSGTGTSAIYGRDCFDKVITACRGGYYRAESTDIVCSVVDYDYYSGENDIERHPCPDEGKTSYPDTGTISECWKNGQPYVAEHGGGERTCKWSVADDAYLAGCGTPTMLYCDGGYWLANGTDIECSVADYAYYSPDRDLMRYACPAGTTTRTQTSENARACFICPENSVCEPGEEIETCDYLTGGLYPKSDAGTSDVAYCYKDCAMAENANAMTGHDYYNAPDTCEITSCATGFALIGGQCATCPEGSFCDGTTGGDGDPDGDGAKSCADLGDGSWMYSDPGKTSATDCYRKCVTHTEDTCTLTPVESTAYWPNNCQYTGESATGNPAVIVDGVCVETSCHSHYEMINGSCRLCNRENALSYKPDGNCVVESCIVGYHPNNSACEPDTQDCTDQAPNATNAIQKWDATHGAFGICTIKSCEDDYHLASNACVPNEQVCDIPHGVGTKTWNTVTNSWNKCIATSCAPGYTNDPYEKNNASEQCGECRNKFSVLGEAAATSYTEGCEIASCLYQGEKYNLDNNECVPICAQPYSDETGSMRWNSATQKCERTCNPGYISW